MKNDLSILLESYRQEVDYLESEMKKCAEEQDYEGAAKFRNAWIYSKQKLSVLNHLENPALEKVWELKHEIKQGERRLDRYRQIGAAIEGIQKKLIQLHQRLAEIEAAGPAPFLDSDELLICLEKLQKQEIQAFEIEIQTITCRLSVWEGLWQIEVWSQDERKVDRLMLSQGRKVLRQLGLEPQGKFLRVRLGRLTDIPTLAVLTCLSVLLFDGFRLYGNKTGLLRYEEV
ncbi:MAG: UvrB/UvrC motif-containing protein [Saprospiraceae bacterium]|nr:UvrB/UvrC motif-containing protein [Saprospiraceae bacterium]